MANTVKHLGIVESINGSYLKVRIVQTSACSSCSVKGHCSAAESKEKLIDVYNKDGLDCQVGSQVTISGATSLGMKAVMWAFVFPFVVLLVSLFISMSVTGGDEAVSSLVSLCMLIPYYLILFLYRERFRRTFVFVLESINN
ncbi:SoxR reducing system RseC family protein [Bacteroides mediterraneensis]|mgnify:FL=1|uniref:SoxR reducing system RseC family protein n=1 Tax=Bacteroides mediterraneensis TaxID=1841856 RepID=A0ABS2ETA4_9BACE|nr:SoxR reducing system RseC family protein [Bacteroides mediterraneensis]MBM6757484.1 SoxR reducing system RseC family protein [Bacteroides mediterraneensis]MBM6782407.1 SoxR reducing system RseC family protein [Bacteroides mediterraneensis]